LKLTPTEFDKSGVSADDAEKLRIINAALVRLHKRRKEQIAPEPPFSKLAWKITNYQQAILYRIVMLASGCALNWNNGNTLCSILAARAMVETAALFMEFETRLDDLLRCSDIDGIDALINNLTFATKDEEFLETWPDNRATNRLTFIDKIDKASLPRMREHYDWLSERCHPNSFGHFLFFGNLDTKTGAATFTDDKNKAANWRHVIRAMLLVPIIEHSIEGLDATISKVADLQSS
jgi:hypothetical protein